MRAFVVVRAGSVSRISSQMSSPFFRQHEKIYEAKSLNLWKLEVLREKKKKKKPRNKCDYNFEKRLEKRKFQSALKGNEAEKKIIEATSPVQNLRKVRYH